MPRAKTIQELQKELDAKQVLLGKLQQRRDKLSARMGIIDRQIAAIVGESDSRRGRRAAKPAKAAKAAKRAKAPKAAKVTRRRRDGKPLLEYIKQVLADSSGMRVRDIAQAVKQAGYKTKAKDFYTIVASTVRDPKQFANLSRGVYKLA